MNRIHTRDQDNPTAKTAKMILMGNLSISYSFDENKFAIYIWKLLEAWNNEKVYWKTLKLKKWCRLWADKTWCFRHNTAKLAELCSSSVPLQSCSGATSPKSGRKANFNESLFFEALTSLSVAIRLLFFAHEPFCLLFANVAAAFLFFFNSLAVWISARIRLHPISVQRSVVATAWLVTLNSPMKWWVEMNPECNLWWFQAFGRFWMAWGWNLWCSFSFG